MKDATDLVKEMDLAIENNQLFIDNLHGSVARLDDQYVALEVSQQLANLKIVQDGLEQGIISWSDVAKQ